MIAAVTCDIINSRKYSNEDRRKVNDLIRTSFDECIELLPNANADKLSFSIIQGDEFQFVIQSPGLAYQFVVFYRLILALKELKPRFRAGIGLGEVSVSDDNSYKMDGSAFHNSRDVLQKFRKQRFNKRVTFFMCGLEQINKQIEIIMMYNDFIEQRWSDKQRSSIYLYNKFGSLEKASIHESVSLQALYQRIKVSGFKQMDMGFFKYTVLVNSITHK